MNELVDLFKNYLSLQSNPPKKVTIKNYASDVTHFIKWYQRNFDSEFNPEQITLSMIEEYKEKRGSAGNAQKNLIDNSTYNTYQKVTNAINLSLRSMERHISSLRKFFKLLEQKNIIKSDPFKSIDLAQEPSFDKDPFHIIQFKEYLYLNKKSDITIKNYILDIQSFLKWYRETFNSPHDYILSYNPFSNLNLLTISEYKERLLNIIRLSPKTINRKLSSIRKYFSFLKDKGYILDEKVSVPKLTTTPKNLKLEQDVLSLEELDNYNLQGKASKTYSNPSLFKKIAYSYDSLEEAIAKKIRNLISTEQNQELDQNYYIQKDKLSNIPKEFYAPTQISIKNYPLHKKIFFHLKHTRPKWYKTYQSLPFSKYLNFSLVIIISVIAGIYLYNTKVSPKESSKEVLSESTSKRFLTFEGKLTDSHGKIVSSAQDLKFAIYNDAFESESTLLWQEAHSNAKPGSDGIFSEILGVIKPIPKQVFEGADSYYLGITIGNGPELEPRQRVVNFGLSSDSRLLKGMDAITESEKTSNVILALDSSGNLTIGGEASPTFQAIGGNLTLSGRTLTLTTNEDTLIDPDLEYTGVIDIQKPIINSVEDSASFGAVEVFDRLAVITKLSDSNLPTFSINQDSLINDILMASSDKKTRFLITAEGMVGIGLPNPSYTLDVLGDVRITGETTLNGVTYDWPSADGLSNFVLTTSGTGKLSWASAASINSLELKNGALAPANSTLDFLIGGNSTESAKFAFITGSTPTASIAGNITFTTQSTKINQLNGGNINFQTSPNVDSNLISRLFIGNSGRIGIGSTNPEFTLDLKSDNSSNLSAMITNTNSGGDADGLGIKLGFTGAGSTTNTFIEFQDGNGVIQGKIHSNAAGGVTYKTSGVDFAEYYKKGNPSEVLIPGTLVCLNEFGVGACDNKNTRILGVISEHPGFVGGGDHQKDPNFALVALVGQVPMYTTSKNGEINSGEALTYSSTPGHASKAKTEGFIVGRALESLECAQDSTNNTINRDDANENPCLDKVLVSLNVSWYNPEVSSLSLIEENAAESLKQKTISAISNFTNSTFELANDKILIAGKGVEDYISEKISQTLNSQLLALRDLEGSPLNSHLASPLAEIDTIRTNIISPLADGNITINIGNSQNESTEASKLVIKNEQNQEIASIDSLGNASFSGQLSASSVQLGEAKILGEITASSSSFLTSDIRTLTSENASVAGTLYAGKLIADQIEGLEEKLSSSVMVSEFTKSPISTDFITINTGLLSLGTATLREATVTDTLSLGTNFILGGNAINVLGGDLELQPLRQGGISLLGGAIKINTNGDLVTEGNVTIKGLLSANVISPLPDKDLVIRLGGKCEVGSELGSEDGKCGPTSHPSNLIIESSSGSAVLSVNQSGDINASGSAKFSKLNLSLVSPAYALSDTESVATGSAGTAVVKAYRPEVTIVNKLVTQNSLIYITPLSDTENQVLYLLRQAPGESFTVGVKTPTSKDILFNWIIVN